jgi:hypothetical protein
MNNILVQEDSRGLVVGTRHPDLELVILRTRRPNVLITGTHDTAEAAVVALLPHLQPPVHCWNPDASLPTPHDVRTVLIRDVATLSVDQQHALLSWLAQAGPDHAQIVSTTALPLFPLLEHGMFLEELYYRLNTVRLDAPAPTA